MSGNQKGNEIGRVLAGGPMLKGTESWYPALVVDPTAIPITRFLGRVGGVSPNHVTIAAIGIRCVALVIGIRGNGLLMFILWQIGFLLDCIDGKLARLTGRSSEWGKVLDHWGDIGVTAALIGAGSYGLWIAGSPVAAVACWVWLFGWVANWFVRERHIEVEFVNDARESLEGRSDRALSRYAQWRMARRLKPYPISGLEEAVLIVPLAFATNTFGYIVPVLSVGRIALLTITLRGVMVKRLANAGKEQIRG